MRLRHGDALNGESQPLASRPVPSNPGGSERRGEKSIFPAGVVQLRLFVPGVWRRSVTLGVARVSLGTEVGAAGRRRLLLHWKICIGHFLLPPPPSLHHHLGLSFLFCWFCGSEMLLTGGHSRRRRHPFFILLQYLSCANSYFEPLPVCSSPLLSSFYFSLRSHHVIFCLSPPTIRRQAGQTKTSPL